MKKTLLATALLAASGSVMAQDVSFSGFGTLGYTENDAVEGANFARENDKGTYLGGTVLGIQAETSVGEVDLIAQVKFGQDAVLDGKLSGSVEYAFARAGLTDDIMVRAGRLRAPFYMNSETLDVGAVRLENGNPLSVYSQAPFNNYNGMDFIYTTDMGDNELSVQLFAGSEEFDVRMNKYMAAGYKANYIAGLNVAYVMDELKLRAGYTIGEMDGPALTGSEAMDVNDDPGSFLTAGFAYDNGELIVQGEFAQRSVEEALSMTANTGAYLTAGMRIDKFTPYVTMQALDTNSKNKAIGMDDSFNAVSLGVKYDRSPKLAIKAEIGKYSFKGDVNGMYQKDMPTGPMPSDMFVNNPDDVNTFSVSLNTTF